ncbi:MFS transporter [Pantanalinema sp. GBBB05]|uniref:MFS transporter n=1 Tax=Pantanalinema sp. GBBB05 TaxID=2604139 RepID=UPI001DC92B58|nr:MFS transporter [Pantanalinema sp. GBBB05]
MNRTPISQALNLPALRSRNYRLFFLGQALSLTGTWMTQIATVWLVYQLSNSPFLLGMVGFASQIPSFVLVPFGGVLVDRWNRHRVLVITQALAMLQSLALAVLALTGVIQVWHIVALALFQGLINAVDAPTRQAFVPELVHDRTALANAIALNSSVFNGARLIGPSIAGILVASIGAGYCFLIDGLSYIAVIGALLAMQFTAKLVPAQSPISFQQIWERLWEGLQYAFGFKPIRAILLLLALVSFMGMPYTVLLPVFATDILKGGADTLGILTAASGIGALTAGIFLSLRKSILGLGKWIALAPAMMGIGLIIFSYSRTLWLSALMMAIVGYGFLIQFASSNTIIQTIVEDDKRGRVMSFYTMAFMGMLPIGSLAAGILADWIGAPHTLLIGGSFCILGSLIFRRELPRIRQLLRPVYQKIGIDLTPAKRST